MQEHRRFPRWQINQHAKLGLIEQAKQDVLCQIKDINYKGARIILEIKLPEDTAFKLNINFSPECGFQAEAWVAWHRVINGVNHYGVYFSRLREADKEKIYKFVYKNFPSELNQKRWPEKIGGSSENMRQIEKGGNDMDDRRIFERFPINLTARYLNLDTGKEGVATTQDFSAKGLGLLVNEELKPHTALEVWLEVKNQMDPLYLRGQVVWAKPDGIIEYSLGVELEKADLMGISRVIRA